MFSQAIKKTHWNQGRTKKDYYDGFQILFLISSTLGKYVSQEFYFLKNILLKLFSCLAVTSWF